MFSPSRIITLYISFVLDKLNCQFVLYLGDVAAAAAATTEDCMARATLLFLPPAAAPCLVTLNGTMVL